LAATKKDCDALTEEYLRRLDPRAELYYVRDTVWSAAGMKDFGGCLCIGCLERRLGRRLKPKDFPREQAFNHPGVPASPRLRKRRKARGPTHQT
jgi:hypothetical protein